MADVVDAFLRGHQAGQSEREHNDALEDNKLRRLVLKHQMDQMKIEDQLRQRAIALENVKLQEGTPEADLTPATTQGGVLPSTPVPGVPAAAQQPTRMAATQIPGVSSPELGINVPGVSVRPRTLEELTRAAIAAEMGKPYTLAEGGTRMIGGTVIGRGTPKLQDVGPGHTLLRPGENGAPPTVVAKGAPVNDNEFTVFTKAYAGMLGANDFADLNPAQRAAVIPAYTKAKQDPALMALTLSTRELQRDLLQSRLDDTKTKEIAPGTPDYKIASDLSIGKLRISDLNKVIGITRNSPRRAAIYALASELNENFNPAAFEMGFKFASNPKVQQQISSLNNVASGVPDLLKASEDASNAGIRVLNSWIPKGGLKIGGKKYTNFHGATVAFADELSGALGYGSATDMSREMGFNMADETLDPEKFASGIQDIVLPFVARKKKSLVDQMGPYGAVGGSGGGGADTKPGGLPAGVTVDRR